MAVARLVLNPPRPTGPTMNSIPVSFRASKPLVTAARDRADREGIVWPAVMRALLFDYAEGRCASPEIRRECNRLARQIRQLGVNVNQIARALNAGSGDPVALAELRDDLEQTNRLLRDVHRTVLARRLPIKP